MTDKLQQEINCHKSGLSDFSTEELFDNLDDGIIGWREGNVLEEIRDRMIAGEVYNTRPRKVPIPKPQPPESPPTHCKCGVELSKEYQKMFWGGLGLCAHESCENCDNWETYINTFWAMSMDKEMPFMGGVLPLYNDYNLDVNIGDKVLCGFADTEHKSPLHVIKKVLEKAVTREVEVIQGSDTANCKCCFVRVEGKIRQAYYKEQMGHPETGDTVQIVLREDQPEKCKMTMDWIIWNMTADRSIDKDTKQ